MSALRDAPSDSSSSPLSPRMTRSAVSCAAAVLASALLLAACGAKNDAAAPAGGGAPPPPEVGVVTVTPGSIGLVNELPGRLEASRVAQVRARSTGILQKRLFTEGSDVKAGQALFQIDDAPYRAAMESARPAWRRPRPLWPRPATW